jgi:hypothetical protein
MKISTILSFPLMAGFILLAILIRYPVSAIFVDDGSGELVMVTTGWRLWMANWPSNGLLVAAGVLFLRFVIEAVR